MHTIHYLLTRADSADQARSRVMDALDSGPLSGPGQWWDWYEVGGRWADAFTSDLLPLAESDRDAEFGDVVRLDTCVARAALEQAAGWQDQMWQQVRADILGLHAAPGPGQRPAFGADFASEAAAALLAPTLEDVAVDPFTGAGMWFWRVETARKLAYGEWGSDSHFLFIDPEEFDRLADPRLILSRSSDAYAGGDRLDPSSLWLVACDFHY